MVRPISTKEVNYYPAHRKNVIKRRKIRNTSTTIRIKPNIHRWLKKFSELNDKTMNETIYFLIAYYTKTKTNKK